MADRPSCTAEYRTEAADFAIASEKSIGQVAVELGINGKTLGRWVTVRKKELANPAATAAAKAEGELAWQGNVGERRVCVARIRGNAVREALRSSVQ
ncbi:MAG: hypothetical protein ACLR3M_02400 [Collinsella sp.]